jgi:hypothetical protein
LQKYETFAVTALAYVLEIERTKGTNREAALMDLLIRDSKEFRESLNAHLESRLLDQIERVRNRLDQNPELKEGE